jgi:PAS domain S-box-containing protein
VLQSLPLALYTASIQEDHRQLQFTNEGIHALTGFTPADFLSAEDFWSSHLHPEDREGVLQHLRALPQTGAVTMEYRWCCADGTYRHFLDQTLLARDEDGRPREYFGLWFDMTERKQLEQNLLHASKLEAVGRLTGGIAHDFNNMLSVVIGNLDLLSSAIDGNERAQRRVRMAMEGAQRCADLTHRLLAFSRRQPLLASTLDVKAIMPGLLELMRRTLGEHINVTLHADEGAWPVRVDRAQFEAALLNLAVNARDAMAEGGDLTIAVENRTVEDGAGAARGEYVVISVADTGTGMPPEVLERVFEPFFTTKESGKGTGLGLSMVYGFVQQSGGHIEVDSVPDHGTTIRIFLPRIEGKAAAEPVAASMKEAPSIGQGESVLVVEDDPAVRQVAVSTLESLGFKVREAQTGDEAASLLQTDSHFRLVLSDVRMPGEITGIDLARMVKREWPSVRVLLTTGYVDGEAKLEDLELLYKPYRAMDLAERIQTLLQAA